ncbi:MAG: aminopeptidase P family protein [Candidatus Bathyarchaeota archaeon]|jgi:Xaa-Pro dipeptidase
MRLEKLMTSMQEADLDSYIITREPNVFYYTGSISGGVLILAHDIQPLLLASRVNFNIAQDQAEGCKVESYERKQQLLELMVEKIQKIDPGRIGFDELSLTQHNELRKKLGEADLLEKPDLVWKMRRVKDSRERELMRQAGELSDIGMEAIREFISEGVREHEIAAEAAYSMRKEGADEIAFPFIVASGPRSAYPHAGVTNRKVQKGDFVTIDMGAAYRGYRSDNTRTFIVGAPTEKQREIYEAVLEANEAAFPEIRDGARGINVDKIARGIIEEAGYGKYFVHSLGHGVGIEVHEPPSMSETSEDTLTLGNIVSNEPGIYIKGYGGVRIEDTVLITSSGPERLTKFDKDLNAMRV